LIRSLDCSLEIREDESNFHGSPKKNLEAVSKIKGILLPRNCFQFLLVKVMVGTIAYTSLKNTKIKHFLTSHRKVALENFFKDFEWIILIKELTGLIIAINPTNSWLNQMCRGNKGCQWKREQPDVTRTRPKKDAQVLTKIIFLGKYDIWTYLNAVLSRRRVTQ